MNHSVLCVTILSLLSPQENTILIKQLRSDLDGLELTVVNNTKQIEDDNAVIKRNTEQLIPLVPLAEDLSDLSAKVTNLENEVKNSNLDLEATDKRQQSALDELERKFNVCKASKLHDEVESLCPRD